MKDLCERKMIEYFINWINENNAVLLASDYKVSFI